MDLDNLEELVQPAQPEDTPAEEPLAPLEPSFSFTMVHERVFVTWFEQRVSPPDSDLYVFESEPKAIELTPEQAEQFNDLWTAQMDQMQALLQGFVCEQQAET